MGIVQLDFKMIHEIIVRSSRYFENKYDFPINIPQHMLMRCSWEKSGT